MGILPRTAHITGGQIRFNEKGHGSVDLAKLSPRSKEFTSIRGNRIGMIFQEPMTRSRRSTRSAARSARRLPCTRR